MRQSNRQVKQNAEIIGKAVRDAKLRHSRSVLLISAEMAGRSYTAYFDGTPVSLPDARYRALLSLVDGRLKRHTGYAYLEDFNVAGDSKLLYQYICRLRQDIDAALGEGVGDLLIETHGACTYRLAIPASSIGIDPDLIELTPVHLPTDLVKRLIENAGRLGIRHASQQPD